MDDGQLLTQGSVVWRDLYGFVYGNLRTQGVSHADAEDLAQDVIISAYVHLEDVEPERQHAWLITVTRNKLVDRARRSGRVHSVAEVPESADPALGPDEVAIKSAGRQMLLDAIACLSERDRHLVEVRYLKERTILETARELGMSESATKVALHRAREREWGHHRTHRRPLANIRTWWAFSASSRTPAPPDRACREWRMPSRRTRLPTS